MLPKKNRADKKVLEMVFRDGRFVSSPNLTLKYFLIKESFPSRISFIVPKTVAKKATARNSLRRLGYHALEKYLPRFPVGIAGAFVFKKAIDSVAEVEKEIKTILNKL